MCRYATNAKKRSELLHDQPISPMDSAVFWVEHVIRHKGAPHLRNIGIYLTWYQYLMLDVAVFVGVVLIAALGILIFIIIKIYKLFVNKKSKKVKQQ